jgi:hypothetical protein
LLKLSALIMLLPGFPFATGRRDNRFCPCCKSNFLPQTSSADLI